VQQLEELMPASPALCYTTKWLLDHGVRPARTLSSAAARSHPGLPPASEPGTPRPVLALGAAALAAGRPGTGEQRTPTHPRRSKPAKLGISKRPFPVV